MIKTIATGIITGVFQDLCPARVVDFNLDVQSSPSKDRKTDLYRCVVDTATLGEAVVGSIVWVEGTLAVDRIGLIFRIDTLAIICQPEGSFNETSLAPMIKSGMPVMPFANADMTELPPKSTSISLELTGKKSGRPAIPNPGSKKK